MAISNCSMYGVALAVAPVVVVALLAVVALLVVVAVPAAVVALLWDVAEVAFVS